MRSSQLVKNAWKIPLCKKTKQSQLFKLNEKQIFPQADAADEMLLTLDEIRECLPFLMKCELFLVSEVIWFGIEITAEEMEECNTARARVSKASETHQKKKTEPPQRFKANEMWIFGWNSSHR